MACEYCDGKKMTLELDPLSMTDDFYITEAMLEAPDEPDPVITVNVDGAMIYIKADYCIKCGRRLGGE